MDVTKLPKSRAEAKATKAKYYFTGEPCKHGHIALRKTRGSCVDCLKVEWSKARTSRAAYWDSYSKKEETRARRHKWYLNNREKVIQTAAARPIENVRQYRKNWKRNNNLQVLASNRVRRRRHREATPPWISRKHKIEMRELYKIAITMTKTTGEQYVVDHIIPLRSDLVCGLHVPWNLRVITQEENLKKSNKLVDDALD